MMTLDVMSAKPRALTTEDTTRVAHRLHRSLHLKGTVSIGVRFVSLQEIQI